MKAHLINTHLVVPRSRSSVKFKVKYQGHVFKEMAFAGAFVFHKHILFHNVFRRTVKSTFMDGIQNNLAQISSLMSRYAVPKFHLGRSWVKVIEAQ